MYCLVGFLCIVVSVFYSIEFFQAQKQKQAARKEMLASIRKVTDAVDFFLAVSYS